MLASDSMRKREQLLARKIAHRQANAGIAVDELQVCCQQGPLPAPAGVGRPLAGLSSCLTVKLQLGMPAHVVIAFVSFGYW